MSFIESDGDFNFPESQAFDFSINSSKALGSDELILLVLESYRNFIGDIDDLSFDWKSAILRAKEHNSFDLNFRFYRTYKGFRFFVLGQKITPNSMLAEFLFETFQVDPLYVKGCQIRNRYAARLSPKKRENGVIDHRVATLIHETAPLSKFSLETQTLIQVHDCFCEKIYYDTFREQL